MIFSYILINNYIDSLKLLAMVNFKFNRRILRNTDLFYPNSATSFVIPNSHVQIDK